MPYRTDCPECGADGQLKLSSCRVYCKSSVPIEPDGFVLDGSMDTDEEVVNCIACGWIGPLQYYEEDE